MPVPDARPRFRGPGDLPQHVAGQRRCGAEAETRDRQRHRRNPIQGTGAGVACIEVTARPAAVRAYGNGLVRNDRFPVERFKRGTHAGPNTDSQNRRRRIATRVENTIRSTDAVFKPGFSEYIGLLYIGTEFA